MHYRTPLIALLISLAAASVTAAHPTIGNDAQRAVSPEEQRLRATALALDDAHEREPDRALLASKRAATLLRLARVSASHADYERAHGAFDAMIRAGTDDAGALVGRGHAAIGLHRFSQSLEDGREACRLGVGTPALALIVDAQTALGNYDEARAVAQSMERDEITLETLARLALIAYERADYAAARAYFTDALRAGELLDASSARRAWCLEMLAQVELESGSAQHAIELLDRAAASHHQTDHAAMTSALAHAAEGDIERAEAILVPLVASRPTVAHHNALVRVLRLHAEPHDLALAKELSRAMRLTLEDEVKDGELSQARDLVELWVREGINLKKAAALAELELQEIRCDAKGYEVASWACHHAGDHERALRYAKRALYLAPERPSALLRCAVVIHRVDAALARTLFGRALQHPATLDESEIALVGAAIGIQRR